MKLGGGRLVKSASIDPAVGAIIPVKVGDHLAAGDLIGTVYASDEASLAMAQHELLQALTWSEELVSPLPHFYETVT